ncbi:hypothetical protein [Litorihabitans aurantiacus]|uniref:Integral membrane protein n=1 Tax=Litorihabitans aurantiacus TaxID=1930061 RepID=A0AA37UTF4_9MICO|nr:hypothetical protein [Litorihabitans aurantiacus]GMA30950.1 hypothetical protein GCM10025875_09420 [Litorihabitans aurantiacus]
MTDPSSPDREPGSYGAPPPPAQPGPYGAPPPPASAYPSPQQGGFPPPPGYSGAPQPHDAGFPPPPPPGYGSGGSGSSDVGAAFSWAWPRFAANWGVMIGAALVWGVGIAIIAGVGFAIAGAVAGTSSAATTELGFAAATSFGIGGVIIVGILSMVAAFLSTLALTHGYLRVADTGRAEFGDFFRFRNAGQGILLVVLMGLAAGLLSFTGIGTLIVNFFGAFAVFLVVDRGAGAIDAIKGSIRLALDNAGVTAVAVLVSLAGVFVCFAGALVTIPLGSLVLAHAYRRSTNGHVPA